MKWAKTAAVADMMTYYSSSDEAQAPGSCVAQLGSGETPPPYHDVAGPCPLALSRAPSLNY